jgi:hypothetical protein
VDETLKVLTNHDLMERHECQPHKRDLELNLEPKSFEDQQEAKSWKDVNKNIRKMVQPSKFHGKDNMTFEDVMSFLETLEVGEDYKEEKQVRIAKMMLQDKAKV